jgi:hypothetical protein
MANLKVIRNKDETITVKVGRQVEHISTIGKDKATLFDQIKYAAISKGVNLPDVVLAEIIEESR